MTAEMIKASGEQGIDVYHHHLCKKTWHQGKWPQEQKRLIFIPIPKLECLSALCCMHVMFREISEKS